MRTIPGQNGHDAKSHPFPTSGTTRTWRAQDTAGRFAIALLVMAFLVFALTAAQAAETARLPGAGVPSLPPAGATGASSGPVRLTAGCDNGVVVFTVKNAGPRWSERQTIAVSAAATGQVLSARDLRMGENQTASFRVQRGLVTDGRYRVIVRSPDGRVTLQKGFVGRCAAPDPNVKTVRR